jgi:hypothetical protein
MKKKAPTMVKASQKKMYIKKLLASMPKTQ